MINDVVNHSYGNLYVISSPSGGGKTTLVNQLIESTPNITRAITHTTRSARPREEHGTHYYFVEHDHFKKMVDSDEFLEYAHVFNNFYGTSKKEVTDKLKQGMDVVLVIDWQGAQQVRKIVPNVISIFILPPSVDALRMRLLHRNQDSTEIVDQRMKEAVSQIKHFSEFDYVIINDDFDLALKQLRSIILTYRLSKESQAVRHQKLIAQLLFASE